MVFHLHSLSFCAGIAVVSLSDSGVELVECQFSGVQSASPTRCCTARAKVSV